MTKPELVCELNELWAAEDRPFRLGKHGVAHLWAVWSVRAEAGQPLLFIVGNEDRAVAQAYAWGASTNPALVGVTAAA